VLKEWVCITESLDKDHNYYYVGDIVEAVKPPNKHFKEMKRGENPLKVLRRKLDDMDIVWSPDWSLDKLAFELKSANDWHRRKAETERRNKEKTIKPR
jgi:hypothetical protein